MPEARKYLVPETILESLRSAIEDIRERHLRYEGFSTAVRKSEVNAAVENALAVLDSVQLDDPEE